MAKRAKRIFIISLTESVMTTRGNRHPMLAHHLVDLGYHIEYISTDFNHSKKIVFSQEEIKQHISQAHYKLHIISNGLYKRNISIRRIIWNIKASIKIYLLLAKLIKHSDKIIIPSRPVELIFAISLLKKQKQISVLVDIRDVWPDALTIANPFIKFIFYSYCNFFLTKSLKNCDKFVHVAPSFLNWLNRYAPFATSSLIPLGVEKPRWKKCTPKYQTKYVDKISLVYIGTLTYQFDILPLLKAITKKINVLLTIIGDDGTGERCNEVYEYIESRNMRNVTLTGFLPSGDVPEHLTEHDIGIVPMTSSALPNKIFDYLGAYLPIISMGDSDASRFVTENDLGWTVSFDPCEISNLLDSLTNDLITSKTKKVIMVRDMYSRDELFKKYTEIIIS